MYFDWLTRMLTKSEAGNCNWIIFSVSTTQTYLWNITHFKSDQAPRVTNCFPPGRPSDERRRYSYLRSQRRRSVRCTRFGWRTLQSSVGKRASDSGGIPPSTRPTLHSQIWGIRWSLDLSASAKDFPSWWRATRMNSKWTGTPGLSCLSKTLSATPVRKDGPNSILVLPPGHILRNPSNLKRWQSTSALKCWPSASWRT